MARASDAAHITAFNHLLGNERIIAPVGQTWDSFFLNGPAVSDDFMSERASQDQPERESL